MTDLNYCYVQSDGLDTTCPGQKSLGSYITLSSCLDRRDSISAQTLSNWIKQAIMFTHDNATTENVMLCGVKAHQVRAVAATKVFQKVSVSVLSVGGWMCHNTFTSYYLKDLTMQNSHGLFLAPAMVGGVQMDC